MHTPTPWIQQGNVIISDKGRVATVIPSFKGGNICKFDQTAHDNADLIVKAVNSYAVMKMALESILAGNTMAGKTEWTHADALQEHYKIARKTLALAEGKEQ